MVGLPLPALIVRLLESLLQFRHVPLVGGDIGGIGLDMLEGGKGRRLLRLLIRDLLGGSLGRTFESGPGRLAIHLPLRMPRLDAILLAEVRPDNLHRRAVRRCCLIYLLLGPFTARYKLCNTTRHAALQKISSAQYLLRPSPPARHTRLPARTLLKSLKQPDRLPFYTLGGLQTW